MVGARNIRIDVELERRAEREQFEIFRGERVPVSPTGFDHGDLVLAFGPALREAARRSGCGRVVTEVGFWLDENVLVAPDLALVPPELVPAKNEGRRIIRSRPRLAVAIVSPGQDAGKVAEKVDLYLTAGVDPVWVMYPTQRLIAVHSPGQPVRLLRADDILDRGSAIPGFAMAVADVYDLVDLA
jgi:Uma2 family endonuclease